MKYICWNIAGIRAKLKKGYLDFLLDEDFDVVCLQETKGTKEQIEKVMSEQLKNAYPYRYWVACNGEGGQRKGLNGVAIWSKIQPMYEYKMALAANEGRTLALDIGPYIIVCVYTPNSQYDGSDRNNMREQEWDPAFREWINNLNARKPTIVCGDFNVAPYEDDVWSHKSLRNVVSHTKVERQKLLEILDKGNLIDSTRQLIFPPENLFTWWSYRSPDFKKNNRGRRLDHIWVTNHKGLKLKKAKIISETRELKKPSDHVPVLVEIKV